MVISLDKLKKGESGTIVSLSEGEHTLKFMEMGCTPGEEVLLDSIAPLGDPIAIIVSGYKLILRRSEAALIQVEIIPHSHHSALKKDEKKRNSKG